MRIAVFLKTYPNIINPCSFLCMFSILVTATDWTTPSNLSVGLLFYGVDRIIESLFTMFRSSPRSKTKGKTPRILVVDDEQDITFTLKTAMEETGSFQVETFNDPVLALSRFKAGEMNGFQLCRKLRDMDNKLRTCFLTATELAYFRETDSDVINDLGRDCFITKPVDNKDIKDKVKAILSKD
jgi:CheY-like chemotaxis protein